MYMSVLCMCHGKILNPAGRVLYQYLNDYELFGRNECRDRERERDRDYPFLRIFDNMMFTNM